MATTFAAFSRDPKALQDDDRQVAVHAGRLHARRCTTSSRSCDDTADFGHDLDLATGELRRALPIINPALETGIPVLERSTELNDSTRGRR